MHHSMGDLIGEVSLDTLIHFDQHPPSLVAYFSVFPFTHQIGNKFGVGGFKSVPSSSSCVGYLGRLVV